jgi:uncharacterized repeat protein (TIGR01451 family)
MKQSLLTISLLIVAFILSIPFAYAADSSSGTQISCQPIYGGGTSCTSGSLTIDKKVQNPQNGSFVDNLGINDPKFAPEQIVTFQITVTNTTNGIVTGAKIKDIFPQFVTLSGGAGAWDSASNTLTFNIADVNPGTTQTYTISGRIAPASDLPANQAVNCVTNRAFATANFISSADTAQFCIQKPIDTVQTTPSSGIIPVTTQGNVVTTTTKGGVVTTTTSESLITTTNSGTTPKSGTAPMTTKGGLKVFPAPTSAKKSPATGPELVYLFASIPAALFGHLLRKKSTA